MEPVTVPSPLPLLVVHNQVLLPSAILRVSIPATDRKR